MGGGEGEGDWRPPKCSSLAARPLSLRRPVMSIAASAAQATSSAATVVPDVQRSNFLPRLFGQRHFLAGEAQIFDTMRRLSPADYGGEFWEFYDRGRTEERWVGEGCVSTWSYRWSP